MMYGIGPVDMSGRVSERRIIKTLGWQPGDHLDTMLIVGGIVVVASRTGKLKVPPSSRLALPVAGRRHCGIEPGDRVLLAAAPEHSLVVVYPLSALNEMLVSYHGSRASDGGDE